jgi:hypothetical protein
MEAAHDDTVVGLVEQGPRKALITARVGEGVEADERLPREVVARGNLEDCQPFRELVQVAPNLMNGFEMLSQDGLEVTVLNAPSELFDPPPELVHLERLQHIQRDEAQSRQHEHDGSQVVG